MGVLDVHVHLTAPAIVDKSLVGLRLISQQTPMRFMFRRSQFLPSISFDLVGGGLDLGERLADLETGLLAETENLEALKVCECAAALLLGTLLGPGGLLPLSLNTGLLPDGLDDTGAGSTWELLEDEWGEDNTGKGDGLTWDGDIGIGGWAINQDLIVLLVFTRFLEFFLHIMRRKS